MSSVPFTIANVFTDQMYTGNHVAVVRNGASISDERKQEIAREIGPAAFVMSNDRSDGAYDLQVFTPARNHVLRAPGDWRSSCDSGGDAVGACWRDDSSDAKWTDVNPAGPWRRPDPGDHHAPGGS